MNAEILLWVSRWVRSLVIVLVFCAVLAVISTAEATTDATWFDLGQKPAITNAEVITNISFDYTFNSARQVVVTTCGVGSYPSELSYSISDSCWRHGEYIRIAGDGYAIKMHSEPHAAYMKHDGSRLYLSKNKNFLIHAIPVDGGRQLTFRQSANLEFTKHYSPGFVEYEFAGDPEHKIVYEDGSPYLIDDNDLYNRGWYSENKEWMAIWRTDGSFILFNLKDFTSRTVYVADYPDDNAYASMAISDDGDYVAVVLFDENEKPRIYNMNACTEPATLYVGGAAYCNSRLLGPHLDEVGTYDGMVSFPALLKFYDSDTISFYTRATDGSGDYWEYIIQAPGTYGRTNYLALGDSFASGEGARNYYKATDQPGGNYCHLSKNSYPYKLGKDLRLDNAHSVACSGARIKNITGPELIDISLKNEGRTNQYSESESAELSVWHPGYDIQIKKLEEVTDIITISIGGNDIGFKEIITNCAKSAGTCYESVNERKALVQLINKQYERLVKVYRSAKEQSATGSRVYAIGYPEIIKPGGNCGNNVRFNAAETEFAYNLTGYLNEIIRLASKTAGVVYVDISDALHGNRLCESTKPFVHGLNTARSWPPFSPESYHPTADGQRNMAETIRKRTSGFSKPMPRSDRFAVLPENDNLAVLHGLLNAADAALSLEGLIDFAYPPNQTIAIRGERFIGSTASSTYGLAPDQATDLWLASDPVYMGTFWSDSNGVVEYDVVLPEDIVPGWHTLHLKGKTVEDQPIDIRQSIYVVATTDDWDGDGIKNENTPCFIALFDEQSGEYEYDWCGNPHEVIVGMSPKAINQFRVADNSVAPRSVQISFRPPDINDPQKVPDSLILQQGENTEKPSPKWLIVVCAVTFIVLLLIYLYKHKNRDEV